MSVDSGLTWETVGVVIGVLTLFCAIVFGIYQVKFSGASVRAANKANDIAARKYRLHCNAEIIDIAYDLPGKRLIGTLRVCNNSETQITVKSLMLYGQAEIDPELEHKFQTDELIKNQSTLIPAGGCHEYNFKLGFDGVSFRIKIAAIAVSLMNSVIEIQNQEVTVTVFPNRIQQI